LYILKKYILRFILLAIFAGYYGSITLFPHYHVVDGVTIVHSHPFKGKQDSWQPDHQHSGKGLVVIQLLSSLVINPPCSCCSSIDPGIYQSDFIYVTYTSICFSTDTEYSNQLRAPPLAS